MTLATYPSPFVGGTTPVTCAFLNYIRASLPNALDLTRGGMYALRPSVTLTLGGTGPLVVSAPSALSQVAGLTFGGSANAAVAGRTYTHSVEAHWYCNPTDAAGGNIGIANGGMIFPSTASGDPAYARIWAPHGSTLNDCAVLLQPAMHSALPGVMPKLEVNKIDITTNTVTQIAVASDNTATLSDYDAKHILDIVNITGVGINEVIDNTKYMYAATIWNEGGADSEDLLQVWSLTSSVTVTAYEED